MHSNLIVEGVVKVGPVSGATISFCRNGDSAVYALKSYDSRTMRVSVSSEVENRHRLAQYLPHNLPSIEGWSEDSKQPWMLMEAIKHPNLLQVAIEPESDHDQVLAVENHILASLRRMWVGTRSTSEALTRDPSERAERVIAAIRPILSELNIFPDDQLIVNGVEVGCANDLLTRMFSFERLPFSVFCHGDPNPENFLVDVGDGRWWLIDFDRVGWHDWRLSLSHFLGWWTSVASELANIPSITRTTANRVEIVYGLYLPNLPAKALEMGNRYAELAAHELGDTNWTRSMQVYIATFLLGELRFLKPRQRQDFMLPLLGEGLTILSSLA
jgi:aminoglycoside phosphotransferase